MKLQKLNTAYNKVICEAVNAPALREVIKVMKDYLQKGRDESNDKKLSMISNEFFVRFNAIVREIPEKHIIQRSLMKEIKEALKELTFTDLNEVKKEILAKIDEYFEDSDAKDLPQAKKAKEICADAADKAVEYLKKTDLYTSYVEECAIKNKNRVENIFSKIDASTLSEDDIEVFLKEDGTFKKFNRKVRALTKMAIGFYNNYPYCYMTFTDAGLIDRVALISASVGGEGDTIKMSDVERQCDKIIAIYNGPHINEANRKRIDRAEQRRFEHLQDDKLVRANNMDRYRRSLNERRRNSEFLDFTQEYTPKIEALKTKLTELKPTMDELDIFADGSLEKIQAFNRAAKIYREIVSDFAYYGRNPSYSWYKGDIIKKIDNCQEKLDKVTI